MSTNTITLDGREQGVQAWSLELGGHSKLVARRLRAGWDVTDAVTVPSGGQRPTAPAPAEPHNLKDVQEDLNWIMPCTLTEACERLGYKPDSLVRGLQRVGRHDLVKKLKGTSRS